MIGPTAATHLKFHPRGAQTVWANPGGAMAMWRDVNDSSRSSVSRMAFDWDRDALGRFFLQHTHCKLPAHGNAHSRNNHLAKPKFGDRAASSSPSNSMRDERRPVSAVPSSLCLPLPCRSNRSHTLQSGPPRSGYDRFDLASLEYLGIFTPVGLLLCIGAFAVRSIPAQVR